MNSPRPVATILVMLIAIGCLVSVQFAWAEGPFDVDNSSGSGRGAGSTVVVDPHDGDDSDGIAVAVRSSTGVIGGDWLTGLVVRWTVDVFLSAEKSLVKHPSTNVKSPAVDGTTAVR